MTHKTVVVMPAYNAAETLLKTYNEVMEQQVVDRVIIVDDASADDTVEIARTLPKALVHVHDANYGYGANQKTCYKLALETGADIVVMVHPDYQYNPRLIPAMVALIESGLYQCALGSRILGGYALRDGMPAWRYMFNRGLTFLENLLTGAKLSEYHTGYRAFSRLLLESVDFEENSDDFIFDNEMLAQILWAGFKIAEITCPSRYSEEASSIRFADCIPYGLGCLRVGLQYRLCKMGVTKGRLFTMGPTPSAIEN